MEKSSRKVFKCQLVIDSPIPETEFYFFLGIVFSGVKLDQEMLQIRADLPRITKESVLLSVMMTSNIELFARGFITMKMARIQKLMALHPSLP